MTQPAGPRVQSAMIHTAWLRSERYLQVFTLDTAQSALLVVCKQGFYLGAKVSQASTGTHSNAAYLWKQLSFYD